MIPTGKIIVYKQHVQSHKNGGIWNDDSIQIAFDTDPDRESVYNPLGGIFSKKITEFCLAGRGKGGQVVCRQGGNPKKQFLTPELLLHDDSIIKVGKHKNKSQPSHRKLRI